MYFIIAFDYLFVLKLSNKVAKRILKSKNFAKLL